ncbi:hypothetical protein ORV05_02030 [Amycolatopsis cynarae]|uniref:Uncharacterized protein n=1 Tax=Amycolatopsis cynarae TaxID=2995223 RepID=A0ABY7B4N7_9PSEU|nr:hypothetical protein [Amycolatopsis sp. HUAS 11-8]WAL66618.1 hypothetical protein ORV05_02030 [Amycolatopsis sp. HUAS 11-8]
MTRPAGIDAEIWNAAAALLEEDLRAYPVRSLDQVRFCGIGVGNTAVHLTADEVVLQVTHTARPDSAKGVPAKPVAVWDLAMPPAFALELAVTLASHARYHLTNPNPR